MIVIGVITTYINAVLIIISVLCLTLFLTNSIKNRSEKKGYLKTFFFALIFVAITFGFHLTYAIKAIEINNRVYITLINEENALIESIVLKAGGDKKTVKNLASNTKTKIYLNPRFDDEMEIYIVTNYKVRLYKTGYVTPHLGGHYIIKIDRNLSIK